MLSKSHQMSLSALVLQWRVMLGFGNSPPQSSCWSRAVFEQKDLQALWSAWHWRLCEGEVEQLIVFPTTYMFWFYMGHHSCSSVEQIILKESHFFLFSGLQSWHTKGSNLHYLTLWMVHKMHLFNALSSPGGNESLEIHVLPWGNSNSEQTPTKGFVQTATIYPYIINCDYRVLQNQLAWTILKCVSLNHCAFTFNCYKSKNAQNHFFILGCGIRSYLPIQYLDFFKRFCPYGCSTIGWGCTWAFLTGDCENSVWCITAKHLVLRYEGI